MRLESFPFLSSSSRCCHVLLLRFFVSGWPTSRATNEKHGELGKGTSVVERTEITRWFSTWPVFFEQNRERARDTRVSHEFLRRCCWFIASLGTRLVVVVVAPPWYFLSFLFHRGVSTATHGIVCRLNKTNNLNKSARCGLRSKDVCGVYVCVRLFLNRIRYFLLIPLISTQFTTDRDRSQHDLVACFSWEDTSTFRSRHRSWITITPAARCFYSPQSVILSRYDSSRRMHAMLRVDRCIQSQWQYARYVNGFPFFKLGAIGR